MEGQSQNSKNMKTEFYLLILQKMAGVVGLEPTVHATKKRCLTSLATPQLRCLYSCITWCLQVENQ